MHHQTSHVNNQSCFRYKGTSSQIQSECKWYVSQIKSYVKDNPHVRSRDVWNWFKPTGCTIWKNFESFRKVPNDCLQEIWLENNAALSNNINVSNQNKSSIPVSPNKLKSQYPEKTKRSQDAEKVASILFAGYMI